MTKQKKKEREAEFIKMGSAPDGSMSVLHTDTCEQRGTATCHQGALLPAGAAHTGDFFL